MGSRTALKDTPRGASDEQTSQDTQGPKTTGKKSHETSFDFTNRRVPVAREHLPLYSSFTGLGLLGGVSPLTTRRGYAPKPTLASSTEKRRLHSPRQGQARVQSCATLGFAKKDSVPSDKESLKVN